jgi:hypothetical protein
MAFAVRGRGHSSSGAEGRGVLANARLTTALTLSVGFLVDDAIVVLENIVRHLEEGKSPREAALEGSREISFTVVSMTVSLSAVFLPVFSDGVKAGGARVGGGHFVPHRGQVPGLVLPLAGATSVGDVEDQPGRRARLLIPNTPELAGKG